jgi:hypothetical protein
MLYPNLVEEKSMERKHVEHRGRRGRFKIKRIESIIALVGERRVIYEQDKPYVAVPMIEAATPLLGGCNGGYKTLVVRAADVSARAALPSLGHLTFDFLAVLAIRLLERLSTLKEAYDQQDERRIATTRYRLVAQARTVTCTEDKRQ